MMAIRKKNVERKVTKPLTKNQKEVIAIGKAKKQRSKTGTGASLRQPSGIIPAGLLRPRHLDYRLVLDLIWRQALGKGSNRQQGEAMQHREAFEELGLRGTTEHWMAAGIRFLGLWETSHYNRYGQGIARDGFESEKWLEVWRSLNQSLSLDRGAMQGFLLSEAMHALAANAGFAEEDL